MVRAKEAQMNIIQRILRRRTLSTLLVAAIIIGILAAFFPARPAQASSSSSYYCTQYHTVRYGENLFRVGLLYGVSWRFLQQINYLPNPNRIYAGQVLCVRASGYVPPPPPPPPVYCRAYYHVRYGDTLGNIARWYGVNVYTLASANGIANINRIYAGQRLCIP
jgi:LysM repeat protein